MPTFVICSPGYVCHETFKTRSQCRNGYAHVVDGPAALPTRGIRRAMAVVVERLAPLALEHDEEVARLPSDLPRRAEAVQGAEASA